MSDSERSALDQSETSFWKECARFVETYADRPDKYSATTEPSQLKDRLVQLSLALANTNCASSFWQAGASVGFGQWAQMPWLAVYDSRETTSAQEGTYIVVHFSWEEPRGIRIGLGVAATEYKRNAARRAREVRDELTEIARQGLASQKFTDVTEPDATRVQIGTGKRASDYADSMIFERFVPVATLKADGNDLTIAFGMLLAVYKGWKDSHPAKPLTPDSLDFRSIVLQYQEQKVVFLSPNEKAMYFIESVDDTGCSVRRLKGEAERVTFSSYATKSQNIREHGRIPRRGQLDNTVARHMCYLQSPELGLSADNQEVVYLGDDDDAATDHFIQRITSLSSPKLYKPAILLVVLDGIENEDLEQNEITFDWLSPRFIELLKGLGLEVAEQQLAEGFARLANDYFWLLAHRSVTESLLSQKPSPRQLREVVSHALIKEPYWQAIQNEKCRARVRQAIVDKWPDLRYSSPSAEQKVDEKSAMRSLIDRIRAKGFVFQSWQIAAYVTALRTKPFVILAGVSGTGKSKLPMLVAELTGAAHPRRVAVRPDWTDSSDVIGYVDLQNQFRPGVILQAMRAASMDRHRFHVCLVDEMNLARVEHYFAEFLSAIEDRRPSEGGGFESTALITQQLANDSEEWSDQTIPQNLGIVGTVNMDESTHGFSRKVLDRAFTIELSEIDLAGGLTRSMESAPNGTPKDWPISSWLCPASRLEEVNLNDPWNMKDVKRTIETLQQVNDVLVHAQLQVGYRTRDEVALFVINARPVLDAFVTNDGVAVDPLDLGLMMKVLPRIGGGSNSIRRALLGLLGIATSGTPLMADADPTDLIETWEREGRPGTFPNARYARTASRLCLMWNRLDVEGYTSYWL